MFQHTAARRRLAPPHYWSAPAVQFQHTAARRRLAQSCNIWRRCVMFQHTAARRRLGKNDRSGSFTLRVSTHSRPKAAGHASKRLCNHFLFQHTAARRRLEIKWRYSNLMKKFQHTAARRRLAGLPKGGGATYGFNTQPPEGGWHKLHQSARPCMSFNTQPPEGGWYNPYNS